MILLKLLTEENKNKTKSNFHTYLTDISSTYEPNQPTTIVKTWIFIL